MKPLLISPHADDETLFAAYTIMRVKSLVIIVTDYDGGKLGIKAETRRAESQKAVSMMGAEVEFLGIPESKLTIELLCTRLAQYEASIVYAPALQGGHPHHDLVSRAADTLWEPTFYATYTKDSLVPAGNVEVIPTRSEVQLKNTALDCFQSQFPWNRLHFDAVRDRSEFYVQ